MHMTAADVITASASVGGKCLSAASHTCYGTGCNQYSCNYFHIVMSEQRRSRYLVRTVLRLPYILPGLMLSELQLQTEASSWTATVSALCCQCGYRYCNCRWQMCKCCFFFGYKLVNTAPTLLIYISNPALGHVSQVNVTYTTQPGMTNYVWGFPGVLSTDYSITSGGTSNDNSVTLSFLTTGSKTVTVYYTNGNGCTAASATSSTPTTVNYFTCDQLIQHRRHPTFVLVLISLLRHNRE